MILSTELTMFHMVRAVPRMATMRAASLKAQTIMAARVAPTMVTPARVGLSFSQLERGCTYLQVIPGLSSKSFSSLAPQLQQDQEFDSRYVEYFNRYSSVYIINHSESTYIHNTH